MENITYAQKCILKRITEKQTDQECFQFYYEGDNYSDAE